MSNDDVLGTSTDGTQAPSARSREEEPPDSGGVFALPEFGTLPGFAPLPELAPLPDRAPLPDIGDVLSSPAAMPGDEAGAGQADTAGSRDDDLFPGASPLPGVSPLPDIAQLLADAPTSPTVDDTQPVTPESRPLSGTAPTPTSAHLPDAAPSASAATTQMDTVSAVAAPTSSLAGHVSGRSSSGRTPFRLKPEESIGEAASALKRLPRPLIALGCVVVLGVVLSFCSQQSVEPMTSSTPSPTVSSARASQTPTVQVPEQAPNLPTRAPGYRGTATNTHALSPEWASGIATAWTIPVENTSSTFLPHTYVDGSTLYVASNATIKGEPGYAVTIAAYDISGEQPTQLWSSTGHTKNNVALTYTPTFVSSDDQLFFHDVVIDKKTGEQTQAPWGIAFPLVMADGILVTCSSTTTCSGWTQEGGEWTNLWTTTTTQQNPSGFRQLDLGYSPSRNAVSGSGEHTSVLVPPKSDQIPQIINIHTGTIASLSNPDGDGKFRTVEVTPEGYVVYENIESYGMLFDSDGTLQSTFKTARNLPIVSHDETPRSAPDVKEFLTHQKAPWAVATLRMTGSHQDECMFEVTFTADGSTRTAPVPDALTPSLPSTCFFDPKQVKISADGSALFMDAFVGADTNKYVIDTVNGEAYMSPALNESEQLTWVYDDMLIGASKTGVTAFVPASS